MRKLVFSRRDKLVDKWERDPYIVIEQPVSDIPIYRVRNESGSDKVRTSHRNLLLPFICISDSENTGEKAATEPDKTEEKCDCT